MKWGGEGGDGQGRIKRDAKLGADFEIFVHNALVGLTDVYRIFI